MAAEPVLLSVVIPTWNREKLISQAIDSVLGQNQPGLEILVVDDGSTDQTEALLQSRYAGKIRFLQQDHRGAGAARNLGIQESRGRYIAFL